MTKPPEVYPRAGVHWARFVDAQGRRRRVSLRVRVGSQNESALVQAALADLLSGKGDKGGRVPSCMTLGAAYLKAHREHWAQQADWRNVAGRWEDVKSFFGEATPVASVSASKVGEFKAHLIEKGNSPKTVNRKLAVLSKLLHLAVEWGELDKLPVMKRFAEKRGRVRWLTDAEEATALAFFAAGAGGCRKPGGEGGGMSTEVVAREGAADMADLMVILLDYGLRLSEALRLQDRDVTPSGVYVPESKGGAQRSVPHSSRGQRVLFLRAQRDSAAHARQAGTSQPFGHLTVDRVGKLWALARTAMRLDLDEEFVIHALRHTFAVRMVEGDADIRIVSYLLGHKKIETTMIYAHVSNRAARAAVERARAVREAVPESAPMLTAVREVATKSAA